MKYLFILLAGCLVLIIFAGCDKESDFEKDYKVYRESLAKRKRFYKICFINIEMILIIEYM